ncbi:glycoside hydrolase family 43 protein [Dyadobacter sandarakinus]|uniref:Glycoside hydrolase family 43 protein n=1 Tax=Dyadobacter sandarakinus TaxID=2747268 RepID=A0ABX7I4T0_9BACT|nr:glycoside hydrolase family 43 protein [Dyadobacter sandarakinus]QRR00228.1 glycoside hydrolase family 43 protein [Dyadobacter sandarakinus]
MVYKSILPLAVAFCCASLQNGFAQSKPQPLVKEIYTADPSAHVFNGKIYIYPSHDIEANVAEDDEGGHFNMRDYHVFSMDDINAPAKDHGVALDVKDIPWAGRQLWAPDAAYKNGTYYLYFPVKDKKDVFRIGVATSKSPTGPFKPAANPIAGSYSIDPAVFTDKDGKAYMYFGGIWGGQLQRWHTGKYDASLKTDLGKGHENEPALSAKVARMKDNMQAFDEAPKDVQLLDENGTPLLAKDADRRFFEGAWMHRLGDKYYFSYSTGDTHLLAYAVGDSPYGPFTYKGVIMKPVSGWTTHHSIIEFKGKWYIFYHDVELSGKTHLRNIKVRELVREKDGSIQTIEP